MKFNIFGSKKKESKKPAVKAPSAQVSEPKNTPAVSMVQASVLKHFYVSEKSTILGSANKYVFKVTQKANKTEVRKQVSKRYNVTVTNVHMINTPRKRRDLGRHPGFRTGFRKAIVTVKSGDIIEQAKA